MSPRRRDHRDAQAVDEVDEDASLSKTQRKQQMHALQQLGLSLLELPETELDAVELDERLREALAELRRIKDFEGRRRQSQYIGKLLRDHDPAPIEAAMQAWRSRRGRDAQLQHSAEDWREKLLASDAAVTAWVDAHPETDIQALRNLVRQARRTGEGDTLPATTVRARRDLFRLLRERLRDAEAS